MKIDELIYTAVFGQSDQVKENAAAEIRKTAEAAGVYPASIHAFYIVVGTGKMKSFTVPAINLRTLTYDTAQQIFALMQEHQIGPVIFEIARSEMGYTQQQPREYAAEVLAAAVKTGYHGPVFIQGDHFQFKAKVFKETPEAEIAKIKALIKDAVAAGFYNIDIDASTLVDLDKTTLDEQQKNNYEMTALITKYIREIEPKGVTVSVGGEIGHIGGKNSTPEEFMAFMEGYSRLTAKDKITGMSKVSVQTGTSHGGVPLPDGTIAKVDLDFSVLEKIGAVARNQYHIGGPVQHGASTLPNDLFDRFPQNNTLEIHLATGFQNIVYEQMPSELKQEMYAWIKDNLKDEWKEGQTEDQFVYKLRKKALGPFKTQLWHLAEPDKTRIMTKLKEQFKFLFTKLNVFNTRPLLDQYV